VSRPRGVSIVALVLLVLAVAAPRLIVSTSTAMFSDTQTAASNVVTASTCTSTTYTSWFTNTANIPSSSRDVYNRLSGSTLSNDVWMSSNTWATSGVTLNQPGALYCDSSAALALSSAAGHADTAAATQATLGIASAASTTVLFWVSTTSTSGGIMTALGNTGAGSSNDRVVWLDTSGYVHFSARSGGSSTSWSITGGPRINDGGWHLVAVAMGGYTGGGATLFVDGASVAAQTVSGTTYAYRNFSTTSIRWTIGDQNGVTTPSAAPLVGLVGTYDEFVVIDTTNLTGAQVATIYADADL